MPDIFLSYSREDDATATRFAEAFKRAGFSVWWDQALRSGETYDEVTEHALREAKAVVVLWSRHSVQSRWVRSEAKIADRNGTFVPVMIEPCDRPVMFELTQTTDLSHWKGDTGDKGWLAVVDDINRLAGRSGAVPAQVSAVNRIGHFRGLAVAALAALLLAGAGTWWLLAGRSGSTSSGNGLPLSIAVLPFTDMTPEGNDAPLADGLSEEISNWLAHIPDLSVVARTSAFKYRGEGLDVRKVGKELDANYIIEGSVRRGRDQVRVTVQLIATKDGYHLWSKTYDLPDTDALHIEDTVSRSVAESLNVRLSKETERRWMARQSSEPEAYDLYLEGQLEERSRTPEHNLRAMDLYRRAIAQDPRFPLAYVSLATATLNSITLNGREPAVVAAEAGPLLDQALALSPDMPEAIAAQGWLALVQYRTDDAFNLMQRALTLKPSDADTRRRMGNLFASMGQPRQAVEQYDLAAQLDPLDFLTQVYRCLGFQDLAQFESAESACAKARKLDDSSLWGPLATSWLEFGRGNLPAALRWTNRAARLAPADTDIQAQRVRYLVVLQRFDAASEAMQRMPDTAEPARSFLKASVAAAQADKATLNNVLEGISRRSGLTSDDWLALTRLQLAAGDVAAAKRSLESAKQSADFQPEALVDATQVKHGYSAALIVAATEIATGDVAAGLRTLTPFDDMLDRMERNGGACNGLYSLRAESLALRGEPDRAMAALQQAYRQGWRMSQGARIDSYLHSLQKRKDFNTLLAQVDREIQSLKVDPLAD